MLDEMDVKILRILQEDCTRSVADVGKEVGLSTTPCWRRIQKLEEAGIIKRRVAVLDPPSVNAGVTVFVSIKTDQHSLSWLERFHKAVIDFPEVVEFYRMSGEVDYLLRVVVPDIAAYDAFYKKLIARIEISKVSSAFAMEQIKYTTALPLEFALGREPAEAPTAAPAAPAAVSGFGDIGLPSLGDEGDDDPLSRKLELADEFRQIGDTDGARDLLHEVVAKASGAVKSRAQSMLAELG